MLFNFLNFEIPNLKLKKKKSGNNFKLSNKQKHNKSKTITFHNFRFSNFKIPNYTARLSLWCTKNI